MVKLMGKHIEVEHLKVEIINFYGEHLHRG